MKTIKLAALVFVAVLLLPACGFFPPTPRDDQILEAILASNNAQKEPLELAYEEMQIPHRSRGRAHGVAWVGDRSIQRNYTIAYDKETGKFSVESFTTLWLGEDGIYRNEQP